MAEGWSRVTTWCDVCHCFVGCWLTLYSVQQTLRLARDGNNKIYDFLVQLVALLIHCWTCESCPRRLSLLSPVTEPVVWKCWAHEKPDLPKAFHERHMYEFGGETWGPPFPQEKKIELRIGGAAISRCMEGLTCTLPSLLMVDHLSRSHLLATPPSLFLCKFGQITRPIFAESWGTCPLETQWLRHCWSRCKAISWLLYSWQLIIFCHAQEPSVSVAEVFVFCSCRL